MNTVEYLLTEVLEVTGSYPHFKGWCPVHPDRLSGGGQSLDIDFKDKGIGVVDPWFHCRSQSCRANGLDVVGAAHMEWPDLMLAMPEFVAKQPATRTGRPWRLERSLFAEASAKLLEGGEPLRWLTDDRGISLDVIERNQIGWDEQRRRWLFPIFEQPTESSAFLEPWLFNALFYPAEPMADGRRKMCCWGGHPTSLYPGEPSTSGVLLVEGELDALAGLSHGLPAVSGTTGAGTWNPLWTPAFAGRRVVISYDCDDAGRTGAKAVAAKLAAVAKSVRVIDLDPQWEQPDGYDLTDWFQDGRSAAELRYLIRAQTIESPDFGRRGSRIDTGENSTIALKSKGNPHVKR